jgi:hypothetical protein
MAGRQGEPTLRSVAARRDIEQIAGRLLLEPFADVPFVQPGRGRELGGGHRTPVGQDPVLPEPIAE